MRILKDSTSGDWTKVVRKDCLRLKCAFAPRVLSFFSVNTGTMDALQGE
jgi:hypothetical protein